MEARRGAPSPKDRPTPFSRTSEPAGQALGEWLGQVAHGLTPAWFAGVLGALPIAICTLDRSGVITYANEAAVALAGRALRPGRDRWCLMARWSAPGGEALPFSEGAAAQALADGKPRETGEIVGEREDGQLRRFTALAAPMSDRRGRRMGAVYALLPLERPEAEDTPRIRTEQRDPLTGLANRQAFLGRLAAALAPEGAELALFRVALSGFKAVNDTFGSGFGDELLQAVAARLAGALPHGLAGRIGGDEFALTVPSGESEAARLAETLSETMRAPFAVGQRVLELDCVIGHAQAPADGRDVRGLMAAGRAAVRQGRPGGGVKRFDSDEQERRDARRRLSERLAAAVAAGEISLHYQPLFRQDGEVAGFEALARWFNPQGQVATPTEFIALAEQTGLIADLGAYVLRSACAEAASWQNPHRIAVNLSALEFQLPELAAQVEKTLRETGLAPERLELEITEGVMMSDAARSMKSLRRLRELGVRIALDDFGTGYSSLSYLHRFPLTTLKIDRSFVTTLGSVPEAGAIVRTVIQLGHALGMEVIAEGVETEEQRRFLFQEGCDLIQGFLLGRPQPPEAYAGLTGRGAG